MKRIILILILICLSSFVLAEDKPSYSYEIPEKLTAAEKADAPELRGNIYPMWGVPCMNFTYYAVYQDSKGREPEYIRINLNNKWIDLKKRSGNPKSGATYVHHYVPTSGNTNFYYFEASNGAGKARASMIDSPDNGPVIFSEKFDNNQIILLDKDGKEIWTYDTGRDWVEGVAVSKDGNYIAAATNFYVYLFSKDSNKPLWKFCKTCKLPEYVSGNFAGVAISADGEYIAASLQSQLYFFERKSNEPLWTVNIESGAIGVDMSDDVGVIAVGVANAGDKGDKIFLFDKEGNTLGEYTAEHPGYKQTGNFYQPDVTPDGSYIAVSTGCPDRRAYLFSGEGNLLFRSEMLTTDTPVHKSAISDDGSLIAYSADHNQGKEIVFLFDNKGKKLWSFSSEEDAVARAVSISGDGNYVAAGTTAGHIYLFSKNNNKPLWKFTDSAFFSQFGDIKLNSDGSLLAAAGTTKKIYLFSKNSNKPLWEYTANTWLTKLDFNGEYIVAGTGPREYFFEGNSVSSDEIKCKEILQSELFEVYYGGLTEELPRIICGDGVCEPPETEDICCEDCKAGGCENAPGLDNCGNGVCDSPGETRYNCAEDCSPQGVMNQEAMKHCGDGICEAPETKDTCCTDCGGCMGVVKKAGDEIEDGEVRQQEKNKSFFSKVINFFKKLFGAKKESQQDSVKVIIENTKTAEKISPENKPTGAKTITETTEKDGRVVENTVTVDTYE